MLKLIDRIEPKWGYPAFALMLISAFWKPPIANGDGAIFWVQDLVRYVLLPLSFLLGAARLSKAGSSPAQTAPVPAKRKGVIRNLATVVVGIAACYFLATLFSTLSMVFAGNLLHLVFDLPYATDQGSQAVKRAGPAYHTLAAIYLSFSAAFIEELYYRYLADRLACSLRWRWLDVTVFTLFSVLLFAAVHWHSGAGSVGNAAGLGLVFGVSYRYTRRFSIVFGTHFLYDLRIYL